MKKHHVCRQVNFSSSRAYLIGSKTQCCILTPDGIFFYLLEWSIFLKYYWILCTKILDQIGCARICVTWQHELTLNLTWRQRFNFLNMASLLLISFLRLSLESFVSLERASLSLLSLDRISTLPRSTPACRTRVRSFSV